MTLFTTHVGWAIREFLQGQAIDGEPASRENPFSEEKYYVEHVDVSDASNPVLFTSGGTFKLIILRIDTPVVQIEPARNMKDITPRLEEIPWTPDPYRDPDSQDR